MAFPVTRLRRLRRTAELRNMVCETRLTPDAFVYPMFVCPGEGIRKEVRSMPGVFNLSVDEAVKEAREVDALGVPSVILFGLPEKKDEVATGAWAEDGIVQQAARAMKREVPGLVLMGDVCLCEYMSHGHCGIVKATPLSQSLGAAVAAPPAVTIDYEIVNDASLELLARTSVSLAKAGIDIIAPSDMMDGRVAAIRRGLDEAGLLNTPILSYAAKFASGYYGPFREAADSAPQFGDRDKSWHEALLGPLGQQEKPAGHPAPPLQLASPGHWSPLAMQKPLLQLLKPHVKQAHRIAPLSLPHVSPPVHI